MSSLNANSSMLSRQHLKSTIHFLIIADDEINAPNVCCLTCFTVLYIIL